MIIQHHFWITAGPKGHQNEDCVCHLCAISPFQTHDTLMKIQSVLSLDLEVKDLLNPLYDSFRFINSYISYMKNPC